MSEDVIVQKAKPTAAQLMALNRKERRRLGHLNDIKIPGSTVPFVKPKKEPITA